LVGGGSFDHYGNGVIMRQKGQGRRQFDGKDIKIVIQKLEQVWGIGGSDAEAAFYADISKAALSDYLKKHPTLTERKADLKNKPILKARQEVVRGLDGNPEFSLKYLERKLPAEFAISTKIDLKGKIDGEQTVEHFIEPKALRAIGLALLRAETEHSK
jgi:hypothetical protein